MLANQVCSLILEKRIRTTVAKAKVVKRLAEKMITLGKRGSLHHRRLAIAKLHHVRAVRVLLVKLHLIFTERNGGYTRIIRLGTRIGDSAQMCYLEWVEKEFGKRNMAHVGKEQPKKLKTTSKNLEGKSALPATKELPAPPQSIKDSAEEGLSGDSKNEVDSSKEVVVNTKDSAELPQKTKLEEKVESPEEENRN